MTEASPTGATGSTDGVLDMFFGPLIDGDPGAWAIVIIVVVFYVGWLAAKRYLL